MNNKGADQTARMRRLVFALVVRIWHKTRFWSTWPILFYSNILLVYWFFIHISTCFSPYLTIHVFCSYCAIKCLYVLALFTAKDDKLWHLDYNNPITTTYLISKLCLNKFIFMKGQGQILTILGHIYFFSSEKTEAHFRKYSWTYHDVSPSTLCCTILISYGLL